MGRSPCKGGKIHSLDQKGIVRVLPQKKKGCLCLDGIFFSVSRGGEHIEPSEHTSDGTSFVRKPRVKAADEARAKMSYLVSDTSKHTAVCIAEGHVILLEGYLSWETSKPPHPRQPIATLPRGHWPRFREVFFTRGGSDLNDRCRVDVDKYGRICCPEGISDGRVKLTGVIFSASQADAPLKPPNAEWDELKLQYHSSEVDVSSVSFDGHQLLEEFIRHSNCHEWQIAEFDFWRHTQRPVALPRGDVSLRGRHKADPMNHSWNDGRLWHRYKKSLTDHFGIDGFHTLLHVSDTVLDTIVSKVGDGG